MQSRKIPKYMLLFFGLAIFFQACEKEVILDLADISGNYVIVDANITDGGGLQWINLNLSSSYYEVGRGEPVTGAKVWIEDGENTFHFTEWNNDSLGGRYYNDEITYHLKESTYYLYIEADGKNFQAQSQWRPVPVLDSVTLKINPFSELGIFDDTIYDVFAHFRELPGAGDHYLFNMFINDSLTTPRPTDKSLVSDINLEEYVSFSIKNINKRDLEHRDVITLEMRSISEENFEFYSVFFFQTDLSGNPFAGAPPANIPTNMSEGAKGFFQVSAVERNSVIYIDREE